MAEEVTLYSTGGTLVTASANGVAKTFPVGNRILFQIIQLDDADPASDGTDTLDVKIQMTIDGTNWIDMVYFAQIDGTASADDRQAASIVMEATIDPFDAAVALTAGLTRDMLGETYRVSHVIVDTTTDAGWDFEVTAIGI